MAGPRHRRSRRLSSPDLMSNNPIVARVKNFTSILIDAGRAWSRDNGSRLAASLAFYAVFSVAPLVMLATGIAGFWFDDDVVRAALAAHIHEFAGPRSEAFVWEIVERWQDRQSGLKATAVALAALSWSTFRGLEALRTTLNMIWGVEKRSGAGMAARFVRRIGTVVMILALTILSLASIFYFTVVAAVTEQLDAAIWFTGTIPGQVEAISSPILLFLLLLVTFKWAANVVIQWRDVLVGAVVTTSLLLVGRILLEVVLAHFASTTVFGTAGAVVALMVWVYLSAMIFFYGAEVTKFWARRHGQGIHPDATATRVENLQRVRQAIATALGPEAVEAVDRELGVPPKT